MIAIPVRTSISYQSTRKCGRTIVASIPHPRHFSVTVLRPATRPQNYRLFSSTPIAKMPSSKGEPDNPKLREQVKEEVKAMSKGGGPGSWSAWKAGELARRYEAKGGGYKDTGANKNKAQKGAPEPKDPKDKKENAAEKNKREKEEREAKEKDSEKKEDKKEEKKDDSKAEKKEEPKKEESKKETAKSSGKGKKK